MRPETIQLPSKNSPTYDLRKAGVWGFFLATAAWLVLYLYIPPCFSGADVFIFKDAGINFASGLGFVTRLNPGNPGLEPSFYASYTPVYPALYGVFVKIFGIGPKVNKVFDVLLTAGAGLMFWFAVEPRLVHRASLAPSVLLLIVLLGTLPVGPLGSEPERPEALSCILTIASWQFVYHGFDASRVFAAAILLGINFLVAPFGFIINGLGLAYLYVGRYGTPGGQFGLGPLKAFILGALGAGIPISAAVILVSLYDPSAIPRFIAHVSGKSIGGHGALGYFKALLAGDVNFYLYPFKLYSMYHVPRLIYLLVVTSIAVGYVLYFQAARTKWQTWLFLIIIFIITSFPILVFAYESCYFGLAAALLIVLLTHQALSENSYEHYPVFLLIVLICVLGFSIMEGRHMAGDIIKACQSGPSYHRMQAVLDRLRPPAGQQPILAATSPPNYFLFKGVGFDVVDINKLDNATDRGKIDLFALSFIDSGNPLKPNYPPWPWNQGEYECIYRPALPQRTELFGVVSTGSNTWEVELCRPAR